MIVVDGRTDREKLVELLQSPEETHLEFKSSLDFENKRDQLNFVKDAISMSNRPPGGYILIGVDNDGKPALPAGTIPDREVFDGARLGDLIRKYIEGEIHVVSQIHELNGHEVVLIFLAHHRDGLPVPMSTLGQYSGQNGKPVVVFRVGDVLVREGAQNTPLRHAHWHELLSRRDQRLRDEARADIDSLISDLAAALRSHGGNDPTVLVPLNVELSDKAFSEAVASHLEADKDIRLRQFMTQAITLIGPADEQQNALDKLTIFAAQAVFYERQTAAEKAVDSLFEAYSQLTRGDVPGQLAIITRVYALGSLAVRLRQWHLIHTLALRPYPPVDDGYVYSSWIRHGQVYASRANLFPDNNGGMLISAARALLDEHPTMRPDILDRATPDPISLVHNDVLFNSLCQFDILYCVIVTAEGKQHSQPYPAASAMDQSRTDPVFEVLASSAETRAALFPDSDDHGIATALLKVFENAVGESLGRGGSWRSLPPAAKRFVAEHLGIKP